MPILMPCSAITKPKFEPGLTFNFCIFVIFVARLFFVYVLVIDWKLGTPVNRFSSVHSARDPEDKH